MSRWSFVILVVICCSCFQEQASKIQPNEAFYDIKGLVDEQIKMLDSIGPSIIKKANMGLNEETNQFVPADSIAWSKEIYIFKSIDINKPLLKDSYTVADEMVGNYRSITYSSKYPSQTIVDNFTIQLTKEGGLPLELYASLDSRNPLYKSVRTMEMRFTNLNGKQVLSHYKSRGWQKMISKDSAQYSIDSEVIYN